MHSQKKFDIFFKYTKIQHERMAKVSGKGIHKLHSLLKGALSVKNRLFF
jgi:hypothetical protein